MRNQPYVKQYDMDIDINNPNFGIPTITNLITKESPFSNTLPFNRRMRNRAGKYLRFSNGVEVKIKGNNRSTTRGRNAFSKLIDAYLLGLHKENKKLANKA